MIWPMIEAMGDTTLEIAPKIDPIPNAMI